MDMSALGESAQREIIESGKGSLCHYKLSEGAIATASDLIELIVNSPADTIMVEKGALPPSFFELRSGVAGEFLQKVANYHCRMVILGDFSRVQSNSLNALILESNRVGKVVYANSVDEAIALLK